MAAPHITGLSALILAHHEDFKERFKARNAERVARLFEILTSSAEALELGDPARTGAGLPNAVNAFAQVSQAEQPTAPAADPAVPTSAQPLAATSGASEFGRRLKEMMESAELTSRQDTTPALKVAAAPPPASQEQGIQALHEMMASAGL